MIGLERIYLIGFIKRLARFKFLPTSAGGTVKEAAYIVFTASTG
jgi:hypothetical protein